MQQLDDRLENCKKIVIKDKDGNPYITRHVLAEFPDGSKIYHHMIHQSDDDKEFHDHPWSFKSYIISGSYIEHEPIHHFINSRSWELGESTTKIYKSGDWNIRMDPTKPHRVEMLESPIITIVYRGPTVRDWGFLKQNGKWVSHFEYLDEKFGVGNWNSGDE